MDKPQTVSLILGSGGARGLAHIGVIRELEARGYAIAGIVGCSMGALVGGLHAAGRLDAYEDWVRLLTRMDVVRFLDLSLGGRAGMLKGDLIMHALRNLVGERRIEDLPIPFTAVATDLPRRREVWLDRGDLFDAIRASIAVPGIFTPKVIDGQVLVDGGLLDPLPVAPSTGHKADLTIAVSLSGAEVREPLGPAGEGGEAHPADGYRAHIEGFFERLQGLFGSEPTPGEGAAPPLRMTDVLLGVFDTMQSAIARYRLASYPPDLLIDIPRNVCETQEFYKAAAVIAAGRHWARVCLDKARDGARPVGLGLHAGG